MRRTYETTIAGFKSDRESDNRQLTENEGAENPPAEENFGQQESKADRIERVERRRHRKNSTGSESALESAVALEDASDEVEQNSTSIRTCDPLERRGFQSEFE